MSGTSNPPGAQPQQQGQQPDVQQQPQQSFPNPGSLPSQAAYRARHTFASPVHGGMQPPSPGYRTGHTMVTPGLGQFSTPSRSGNPQPPYLQWRRQYSQVCGYVNARLSIALVRATHRCLRGSRVPAPLISVQYAQWEDGAGLNLWR
eukprot:scaffold6374_cov39-Attheya_sp.AAC.2